jgi:hypothetical protein
MQVDFVEVVDSGNAQGINSTSFQAFLHSHEIVGRERVAE